jgi:hypothetical protein
MTKKLTVNCVRGASHRPGREQALDPESVHRQIKVTADHEHCKEKQIATTRPATFGGLT